MSLHWRWTKDFHRLCNITLYIVEVSGQMPLIWCLFIKPVQWSTEDRSIRLKPKYLAFNFGYHSILNICMAFSFGSTPNMPLIQLWCARSKWNMDLKITPLLIGRKIRFLKIFGFLWIKKEIKLVSDFHMVSSKMDCQN